MHDETQVMNDEDNANDKMTNGSRTRFFKLQQNIHDVLRIQHPDCVEPDGDCVPPANLRNCSSRAAIAKDCSGAL